MTTPAWYDIITTEDLPSFGVTSATGTVHQVLVNGTSGIATTGPITLTTPQDIDTISSPTFAAISLSTGAVTGYILQCSNGSGLAQWVSLGGIGVTSAQGTAPIQVNGDSGNPHDGPLTISITAATYSNLGAASFNSTNFTVGSGAVNTIQGISTAASPQFVGLNLSGLTISQVVVTDGSKNLASLAYSSSGGTSNIVSRDGSGNTTASTSTATITFSSPSLLLTGSGSGTISVLPQAAAGTYNFNLPTAAGTSGYFLTSAGGGSSPMTWTSISGAGGITTINGDSGSVTPTAGVITITGGSTGLTTSGSVSTLTLVGILALASGGTNANLTASNGGIFYSTASAGAILAGTATAKQILMSGASTTPAWSTATYPATTTINQLLYSSSNNVIAGLATATTAVLTTSSGVPTWASVLSLALGGTNASLTASNGGIFYSTASAGAILSGTATANQMLQSGSSTAPAWSTTTWPATTSINTILYSSSASVIGQITAANNGVLISGTTGIPSWLAAGTTGQVLIATTSNPASWGTLSSIAVTSISGTANQIAASASTGAVTLSFTNGISIGSYQGTSPPTGGIICPGNVYIGANGQFTPGSKFQVTGTTWTAAFTDGTYTVAFI